MSSKMKFDEIIGEFGECRNFWKYNVMDLTGYTTRYEAAIKDEHRDDNNKTTSPLTGYDGLFYPDAARRFLELYSNESESESGFGLPDWFFVSPDVISFTDAEYTDFNAYIHEHPFIKAVHSVYWQLKDTVVLESGQEYEPDDFYLKWYSHLNYTRLEYQKIAMQLWYWRNRIVELI